MAGNKSVGFIGLGMMGLPMARNLLARGHAVLACDPNPAANQLKLDNWTRPSSVISRFASTFLCMPAHTHNERQRRCAG